MLNTIDEKLTSAQSRNLKRFGQRLNKFNVNFAVCDADRQIQILCQCDNFQSTTEKIKEAAGKILNHTPQADQKTRTNDWIVHDNILAFELKSDKLNLPLLVDLGEKKSDSSVEYLAEMISLFTERFILENRTSDQMTSLGVQLSQTYEELMLLHKLSTNMRITESDSNFLQLACDNLTDIINVGGIAVLLEKSDGNQKNLALVAGLGVIDIDDDNASLLYSRLIDELTQGKEALLDSEVDAPFKYNWPESVKNIIAVPLCGKGNSGTKLLETSGKEINVIGMMVAVNIIGKEDFNCPDIKLFNSVANSCAVFIENGNLFKDLKELFIGTMKALTSSIDAKDKYTRGHSERVAFISKWIAEKYSQQVRHLDEDQIHKIYLAGLLHDIGKMGVDESVLRKDGKLTDAEYDHIKSHPSVGQAILSGIKQMKDIVPGVVCHHERIDGKGYPKGLTDKQVPLIGKIIALADSFDAMTSRRTYRNAMDVNFAIDQIEKGLGTQFDPEVGTVFIQSDIKRLWNIIQDGFIDQYDDSDFSEYGTVAVGTLIK